MIRRMKVASASSIFRFSVILPLVGAILGALIGMWVKEGIAPLIIGAVWGGFVGFRAAKAEYALAKSRFFFVHYVRMADPPTQRMVVQMFGALLMWWLTDVDAFACLAILLGLCYLLNLMQFVYALIAVAIVNFVKNKVHTERQREIAGVSGNIISNSINTYIYWLLWPAICLAIGLAFPQEFGGDYDWIYRLLAAWACPYMAANYSSREYRLAESDEERERQVRIFRRWTMLLLALFAFYAHFPAIPAVLYFWWIWT